MSVNDPTAPVTDGAAQSNPWVPGGGVPAIPQQAAPAYGWAPAPATGPLGKVRGTGVCMLLTVVTLGVYSLVWFYKTHEEMKRHTGQGLGGAIALVLAIFLGAVLPFLTSNEVGDMYERRGQAKPVTALTGLWYFPGVLLLVGPIVWFVQTNGALNAYWRSLGAR